VKHVPVVSNHTPDNADQPRLAEFLGELGVGVSVFDVTQENA
jgi:hypothetical protein